MNDIKFTPFSAAAGAAIFVGIVMALIKYRCKKYKFEHFYFMTIGMILIFVGALVLEDEKCE